MDNLWHSAYFLLVVIAFVMTLVSGCTNPSKVPLWIPVLLLCIACMVVGVPGPGH